jgi:hypothetical protein
MARRRLAPAANSRNSRRSLRASRATRRYGTATPTDEQIRAQAASDRGQAFSRARVAAAEAKKKPKAKPKSPTGTAQPQKKKQPTKKVKPTKEKPSFDKYLSEQTPANARNAIDNASGRGGSGNTITGRDSYTSSGRRSSRKSLDEIQGFLQGMNQIIKNEQSTQARMTGNNLDTKMRHTTGEDGKRKVKEVKTGDRFNLESRIGDAATKATCPLWKAELNDTFNHLLDNFQDLYKTYEDDKFNEAEGKGKKPKITNTGRRGRGSLGGDTQAQPKAIGESRADQAVMQS